MFTLPSLAGLALNFDLAAGAVPDWIEIVPSGPEVRGRDGRQWRLSDAGAVAARFDPAKEPQVDIEHSSQIQAPKGLPAPAVGWIKGLEARGGAIWARVDWTAAGREALNSGAYRYVSPVFTFDKASAEIHRIVSLGLTNTPNLELAALNAAATQETCMVDPAILEALGLKPTAEAADVVLAVNRMKEERQIALNRAEAPDAALFVPRADHDLALNRIAGFEAEAKIRAEGAITAAVDAAVAAGKIAPASRDYHLASCRAEGGLERFTAFIAAAPAIVGGATAHATAPDGTGTALNSEERAAARALGMSEADYAAAKEACK